MTWDSDRVRIELGDAMSIDPETLEMTPLHAAEIWLSDGEGKILRTRKPSVRLVDQSRPGVLRQLADWIEARDDPSLLTLARENALAKLGGTS
jgi:hypothetical protein